MADRLSNPFSGGGSGGSGTPNSGSDDFLSFSSSTPNPGRGGGQGQGQFSGGERGFKPKWGKKNRQDNWNRFGAYENNRQYNNQNQGIINCSSQQIQAQKKKTF